MRGRAKCSIGEKQRSRCGPNILSGPCVVREGFSPSLSVSQSQVKMNVRRAEHNNVKVKDEQAMFLFPPGVPTALLVLALLFFAAAAGLAICYVKRWSGQNIIYLVTFAVSLSCVLPNLWRWQFSYTAYFLLHLPAPRYHTVFPTISAHAYQPAFKYRLLAVPLKRNK